jgi:hypothetical protein
MKVVGFPRAFSQEEIKIVAASVFAGSVMEDHWTFAEHGRERPSPHEEIHLYLDFKSVDDHVIRIYLTDVEAAQALSPK